MFALDRSVAALRTGLDAHRSGPELHALIDEVCHRAQALRVLENDGEHRLLRAVMGDTLVDAWSALGRGDG